MISLLRFSREAAAAGSFGFAPANACANCSIPSASADQSLAIAPGGWMVRTLSAAFCSAAARADGSSPLPVKAGSTSWRAAAAWVQNSESLPDALDEAELECDALVDDEADLLSE